MKIVKIEDLHCDAGWRVNSFLKGHHRRRHRRLVGIHGGLWGAGAERGHPETRRTPDRPGPAPGRAHHRPLVRGDAAGRRRAQRPGDRRHRERALYVDIKAKALGVPVYEMLGGPIRDRLQVYWSHCGTYRARHADKIREWAGVDPVRSLDDVVRLGAEVKKKGFRGLKTNLIRFDKGKPYMYGPGTNTPRRRFPRAQHRQDDRRRRLQPAGRVPRGGRARCRALSRHQLQLQDRRLCKTGPGAGAAWTSSAKLEIDLYDPGSGLALIRRSARTPIASCESLVRAAPVSWPVFRAARRSITRSSTWRGTRHSGIA